MVYHFGGELHWRVEGGSNRHLFDAEGLNTRQCVTVTNPARGEGYCMVSCAVLLYTDAKTGAVIRTWNNPWTGKPIDGLQVANDPENRRPAFPIGGDGKPIAFSGTVPNGRVFMPAVIPLWYTNPMGGDYQQYVGNRKHSMEISDFVADDVYLLDSTKARDNPPDAWVHISPFLRG